MPNQPSPLETLPLTELRSLAESLMSDPSAPRTRLQRVKLTTISAEVIRRLDESHDDAEVAALQDLMKTLYEWLDDNRRLGPDDDDPSGGFRGPCMCSTARIRH